MSSTAEIERELVGRSHASQVRLSLHQAGAGPLVYRKIPSMAVISCRAPG